MIPSIHIETTTHVLEGHGFISNDKLTGYRIIRPTGIFPVDRAGLSSGSSRASASSSPVMEPVAAVEAVESSPETSASPARRQLNLLRVLGIFLQDFASLQGSEGSVKCL